LKDHFLSFLGAAFLAAAFLGAAFLAAAFLGAAATLAGAATFLAFGSEIRAACGAGALLLLASNFSPLPRIASIQSSVICWRWPFSF